MDQKPLTLMLPIKPGGQYELEQLFNKTQQKFSCAFGQSRSTHSAGFTILPSNAYQKIGPRLLFTSNYDGEFELYCREVSLNLGWLLDEIWSHCFGYENGSVFNRIKFNRFVQKHRVLTQLYANALPGVSVQNISESEGLRNKLDHILDEVKPGTKADFMQSIPFSRTIIKVKKNTFNTMFYSLIEHLAGIRKGVNDPTKRVITGISLYENEDKSAQNRMTVIVPIKPNAHLGLLWSVLLYGNIKGRLFSQKKLGRISDLVTIHFARWCIVDGGKNFLFESVYDGSWESYIDDFVDLVSQDMNCIWGNCTGFPRLGSKDIESFKQYIRQHQVPSQLSYLAYPNLTVRNILTNLSMSGVVSNYKQNQGIQRYICGLYQS